MKEIRKFCDRSRGDKAATWECLLSTDREFSPDCRGLVERRRSKSKRRSKKNLRKACRIDISKYCSDVKRDKHKLLECLNKSQDTLMPDCRMKLEKRRHFQDACQTEINTHCASIDPIRHGRLKRCLKKHLPDLSQTCQAKFRRKLADQAEGVTPTRNEAGLTRDVSDSKTEKSVKKEQHINQDHQNITSPQNSPNVDQ